MSLFSTLSVNTPAEAVSALPRDCYVNDPVAAEVDLGPVVSKQQAEDDKLYPVFISCPHVI
jgi:hypothetical protein